MGVKSGGVPDQAGRRDRPRRVPVVRVVDERVDPAPRLGRHPVRADFRSAIRARSGRYGGVKIRRGGVRVASRQALTPLRERYDEGMRDLVFVALTLGF